MVPDLGRGVIRELTHWGARLVVLSKPPRAIGEWTELELRDERRVIISCRARIMGVVEYDIGYELMVWISDDGHSWRALLPKVLDRFSPVDEQEAFRPSRRLPSERIPARIRALASDNARATVRSLGCPDCAILPARLDPDEGLLVQWTPESVAMKAPFEIEVEGPFSSIKFEGSSLASVTQLSPTNATVVRRRQLRRVGVPAGAQVILPGVGGDEQPVKLEMRDVSLRGVSAVLDEPLAALECGVDLPEVVLSWRGGPGICMSAEVRHRTLGSCRDSELLGLELRAAPDDRDAGGRWTREVEHLLYPTTRSYGYDYQSLWDLYEESGYFDISEKKRRASTFQHLRNSFEIAYRKINEVPDLGCLACYESPSRVEATMTGLRAWSRSWLGMHLARDPVRPHLVNSDSSPLKDIHFHVFERAGANLDLNWILIYVRDDAPTFSAGLYRDLILSVPGSCGVPFEAWKFAVSMRGDLRTPHVSAANEEQIGDFLDRLGSLRPAAYLDAHDLLPETFYQEEFGERWRASGLTRDRTVLVATRRGRLMAAAVLEVVDDGLHLYGLLDSARLYELEPGGYAYFDELLLAANEWFYSVGKSHFVCFDEDGVPGVMESAGATSIGKAIIAHLPRAATPEMLERVAELTAPKPKR